MTFGPCKWASWKYGLLDRSGIAKRCTRVRDIFPCNPRVQNNRRRSQNIGIDYFKPNVGTRYLEGDEYVLKQSWLFAFNLHPWPPAPEYLQAKSSTRFVMGPHRNSYHWGRESSHTAFLGNIKVDHQGVLSLFFSKSKSLVGP